MSFESLGLRAELLRALSDTGYTRPTPIQAQCIPPVLAGRDVLAGAQTGTGKTAGFTLPLLQRLTGASPERGRRPAVRAPRPVRALIVTPTRELASQVDESVRTYGRHLPHRSFAIFGGVGITPQIRKLRGGVDIVVATPGRLLDHITQRTVDLSRVEILVLDEADRMLDMGFIRDIRRILGVLPRTRQTLLFSATFSDEIRRLAADFLTDPVSVQATPRNAAADLVTQAVHPVDKAKKRALLSHLIREGDWRQVLVFTRTKHGANRLATQLAGSGITATAIHGNKSQTHRTRSLEEFKRGAVRVLVATDIAARGLDIDQLPHVVNYDLSHVPEDYVHRIGRTGRAGREGTAVSLVSMEDLDLLAGIERLLGRTLPRKVVAGFEPGAPLETPSAPAPRRPGGRNGSPKERRGGDASRQGPAPRGGGKPGRVRKTRGEDPNRPRKLPAGSVRSPRFAEGDRLTDRPEGGMARPATGRKPRPGRSSSRPRRPRSVSPSRTR